jgi:AraC family transcriptional regulator of adaptative response/methylated-DNA-[protein]-cysteine methyltransferase
MNNVAVLNYHKIAKAIEYVKGDFNQQLSLVEIAEMLDLTPLHFEQLFMDWAGVKPEKFLKFIGLKHAKQVLKLKEATLFDAEFELPKTNRLPEFFVNIESMTPEEFKNDGENLTINYAFSSTRFGEILIASTPKGICYMAFADNQKNAFQTLEKQFPKAIFQLQPGIFQEQALLVFNQEWSKINKINLHLKGTEFQLKVWKALLKIPTGNLSTYGEIAQQIQNPNASRAVGTAIGSNPIAFLIPCHRVIQSSGNFGGYMWGNTRKTAIIGWEAAQESKNFKAIIG